MRNRTRTLLGLTLLSTALTLTGCGGGSPDTDSAQGTGHEGHSASSSGTASSGAASSDAAESTPAGHAHEHQHPADGGPAPDGIEEATDPTYPVGTEVTLSADHMPGMDGAAARISGAFKTTAYEVSYTPTDGGAPVENHRWVVQEELELPAGQEQEPLSAGDKAVIMAEHMVGMAGAEATIDDSTEETVYMVDVEDLSMTNHKWVVESEVHPADHQH